MTLKKQALGLPTTPGCYLMRNKKGIIIYIGKAINLKRRVSSYFNKQENEKIKRLVFEIDRFETINLDSDEEALALEALLIRRFQPYYNRALKDERLYSYLKITDEKNPRLLVTEEVISGSGNYFGPYSSKRLAELLFCFLEKKFPLSKCLVNSGRPCIYVPLGMCLGGCFKEVSSGAYNEQKMKISQFLTQSIVEMTNELIEERDGFVTTLAFERAREIQTLISILERKQNKQQRLLIGLPDCEFIVERQTPSFMIIQVTNIRNELSEVSKWWTLPGVPKASEIIDSVWDFFQHTNRQEPTKVFTTKTLITQLDFFEHTTLVNEGSKEVLDFFQLELQGKLLVAGKVYEVFQYFVKQEETIR